MPQPSGAPPHAAEPLATAPLGEKPHRYEVMDALRGIAAIAIVCLHENSIFIKPDTQLPHLFLHGWLAVDLFFMLSGFVMSYSYQQKLDAGLPSSRFLLLRAIRIYPLAILGTLTGFYVAFGLHHFRTGQGASGPFILLAWSLLLLPLIKLPWQSGAASHNTFPYNVPYWSLFIELVANVAHSLFLRRRKASTLIAICGTAAVLLLLCLAFRSTLDFGARSEDILPSFIRVAFGYTLGMLLFRASQRPKHRAIPALVPIGILIAILAPPELHHEKLYELLAIFLVLPGVVFMASRTIVAAKAAARCNLLGTISYAIYALHYPLAEIYRIAWIKIAHTPPQNEAPWSGILLIVLLCALCIAMDAFYDIPIRRYLRQRLQSK